LQNFIEQLIVLHEGKGISENDVEQLLVMTRKVKNIDTQYHKYRKISDEEIMETLNQCKGNQSQAAKIMGINRATLWRRLKKLS